MDLPESAIAGIMTRALPANAEIFSSATRLVKNCTTEFASSLSHEAITKALMEGRKKVTADDFLYALRVLGYENYVIPMQIFLDRRDEHLTTCQLCSEVDPNATKAASSLSQQAYARQLALEQSEGIVTRRTTISIAKKIQEEEKEIAAMKKTYRLANNKPKVVGRKPHGFSSSLAVQKIKVRKDWTDPAFLQAFSEQIFIAYRYQQREITYSYLKSLAKELNIPMREMNERYQQWQVSTRMVILAQQAQQAQQQAAATSSNNNNNNVVSSSTGPLVVSSTGNNINSSDSSNNNSSSSSLGLAAAAGSSINNNSITTAHPTAPITATTSAMDVYNDNDESRNRMDI